MSAERPAEIPVTTRTDSLGRFALGALPAGSYVATFWHPRLDSLGLTAGTWLVTVRDTTPIRLALATPPAVRVRAQLCGGDAGADSTGALVGYLLGAGDRAPLEGGTVTARWLELGLTRGTRGLSRDLVERHARTSASGWFALCGIPLGADVTVIARGGADSSGTIPLRLPASGIARRDLYVGAGAGGRIAGTVRGSQGGPVRGANVIIAGTGARATTDERGQFALRGVPEGTRTLSVRAVGYFPEDRAIDVLAEGDEPTPGVSVSLASVRSVLDTIKVVGERVRNARLATFEERRRTRVGTFLDSVAVARRIAWKSSDFLTTSASMKIVGVRDRTGALLYKLHVRGGEYCVPLVYVDGHPFPLVKDIREMDGLVRPEEVLAVELYTAGQAPAEISRGHCAYVVITTRR